MASLNVERKRHALHTGVRLGSWSIHDRDRKLVYFTYLGDVSNLFVKGWNMWNNPFTKYQQDIQVVLELLIFPGCLHIKSKYTRETFAVHLSS